MKEFWNTIQLIFTAIGGWLGYFLGGCDGLLVALVVFVTVDYITGVMCAAADKKLSSEVGFKGICRKVLIFLLVGIANILDVQVIGTGSVLRTAVIMDNTRPAKATEPLFRMKYFVFAGLNSVKIKVFCWSLTDLIT